MQDAPQFPPQPYRVVGTDVLGKIVVNVRAKTHSGAELAMRFLTVADPKLRFRIDPSIRRAE